MTQAADEVEVRELYRRLIDAWNGRSAAGFAAELTVDATVIGFDGSVHEGRDAAQRELAAIFTAHQTPPYIAKVRSVRLLTAEVALLGAVVGMAPPGKTELDPGLNAVQSTVAVKIDGRWRVAVFQNTPAAFHGRPELAKQLTEELQRETK